MREKRSIWTSCNINYKPRCSKSSEKRDHRHRTKPNLELYMSAKATSDAKSCKAKKYRTVGFLQDFSLRNKRVSQGNKDELKGETNSYMIKPITLIQAESDVSQC